MTSNARRLLMRTTALWIFALLLVVLPKHGNAQVSATANATINATAPPRDAAADREAVRNAALDYVEGFYEGDSVKFMRGVRPEFYKYGFDWVKDSLRYVGEQMPWADALSYIRRFKASGRKTPATAPKVIDVFDVQDQTASAKLTAWWGIDYLLLARYNGHWMISHVMWQSPPPPPGGPQK